MKKIPALFLLSFLLTPITSYASSQRSMELRAEPEFISPNKDDIHDQIFFYPVLDQAYEITHWQLDIIRHSNGKRVRRLMGSSLPALIKWDATDKGGGICAPGAYDARLTASGNAGKVNAITSLVIDLTPPVVGLDITTPTVNESSVSEDYALTFTPSATDSTPLEQWQIQIIDPTGRTVSVLGSTGAVHPMRWDGTEQDSGFMCPSGEYEAAFIAWDFAGNQSQTVFVQFQLQAAPRDVMVKSFKLIKPSKYPGGLLVRINSEELFSDARPTGLSAAGRKKIHELAMLIIAHPEARVYVSGYKKNGVENSLGAWLVYNHLVKSERIPSGRFILQETPSGRRSSFKDGVEVMLEGGSF